MLFNEKWLMKAGLILKFVRIIYITRKKFVKILILLPICLSNADKIKQPLKKV